MYRIALAAVAALVLGGCAAAEPPPLAPPPEPEPEEEVVPEVAVEPEVPLLERIRAPFAVQSSGQPSRHGPRAGIVRRDGTELAEAEGGPADTAAAPEPPAPAPQRATPAPRSGGPAAAPAAGATQRPAAQRPAAARQHAVASGETFYAVARQYGVTPSALAAVNPGVDIERLRVGQVLQLPAYATPARPAQTAGAGTTSARPGSRTHQVAAGETLWAIARRYGVTPQQIRAANRMTDDVVRVGQRLIIP